MWKTPLVPEKQANKLKSMPITPADILAIALLGALIVLPCIGILAYIFKKPEEAQDDILGLCPICNASYIGIIPYENDKYYIHNDSDPCKYRNTSLRR